MPNNAVMPQSLIVLIVLVDDCRRPPAQWVQSSFVASHHHLASFWRQTNIKISRDLGVLYSDGVAEENAVESPSTVARWHLAKQKYLDHIEDKESASRNYWFCCTVSPSVQFVWLIAVWTCGLIQNESLCVTDFENTTNVSQSENLENVNLYSSLNK